MLKQGKHLQEVGVSFQLTSPLKLKEAKMFVKDLIKAMGVKKVSMSVNKLPPGFDILCGIKESCIYLGYWGELNFVRLFLASCKPFDETKIEQVIQDGFFLASKIKIDVYKNSPIEEEVNSCH